MNDDQLRTLVREAITRHLGPGAVSPTAAEPVYRPLAGHSSHARLPVAPGSEGDGLCLIEPAVRCNHCGYCQSYGH